ncbi:MAG: hypothetical protein AABY83_10355 [Pseudomonadota bacterium]
MLEYIVQEPGIFIGLAVVVVATLFLPARIRWYVFTAGLAVVLFRAYQVYWANRRLLALDKERTQLRGELTALRARNTELENIHQGLMQELEKIKAERTSLIRQREALDQQSKSYAADLVQIETQLAHKKRESQELVERSAPIVNYLEKFAIAERVSAGVPEHI